jgi:hypothetical protein
MPGQPCAAWPISRRISLATHATIPLAVARYGTAGVPLLVRAVAVDHLLAGPVALQRSIGIGVHVVGLVTDLAGAERFMDMVVPRCMVERNSCIPAGWSPPGVPVGTPGWHCPMRGPESWQPAQSSECNCAACWLRRPVIRAAMVASRIKFAAVILRNFSTTWPIRSHRIGH